MTKYIVKHTTIMHNGKTYAEGSQIDLSDNEAARLEDFLEAVPKQTTSNKSTTNTANKTQTSTKSSTQNKTAAKTADGSKDDGSSNTDGGSNGNK